MTTQVSSFLCPSDGNPGRASNSTIVVGQVGNKYTATCNYPTCFGLNRAYNNWLPNGPSYLSSSWDGAMMGTVALNNFTDGTSNTAIFSEWVKGSGVDPGSGVDKNVLGMVYGTGVSVNNNVPGQPSSPQLFQPGYPNDILGLQACQNQTLAQDWSWKGEWAYYGKTMHYTHTNPPNRKSCVSDDFGRAGDMISASSLHAGRGQRHLHGRLGPIHQVDDQHPDLVRDRHAQRQRADQRQLALIRRSVTARGPGPAPGLDRFTPKDGRGRRWFVRRRPGGSAGPWPSRH